MRGCRAIAGHEHMSPRFRTVPTAIELKARLYNARCWCRRAQTAAPKQLPDVEFEEQVDPGIEVC